MVDIITEYVNAPITSTNVKWWTEKKSPHKNVFGLLNYLEKNQSYRSVLNLRYARLYSNMEMLGLSSGTYARTATNNFSQNRLTLNVIKSCVDSAAAKIAKNKPKPLFLTKKGDFSLKRKAKGLTKYLEGLFETTDLYELGRKVFIDACVFGTGALKLFIDSADNCIKAERVFIDEIVVDDVEGIYSKPRQIFQRKNYSRDVLIDMFPDYKEEILAANTALRGQTATQSTADQVIVVEAWHLPSGPNAKDGKHVIALENCTLFEEEYTKDYFPFVFFRWTDKLVGFWGMGLAEELIGIQLEINKVLKAIQASHQLMSVPRVFVDVASNVNTAHITNEIGGIIKYQGQPPVFQSPGAMNPEVYSYLNDLYRKAYEITGISQMQAQAMKPSGLNSGAALREFNDIASERFVITGMRYEEFFMQAAKIMIDMSKDLFEIDKSLKIKVKGQKFIETIKWKDVNLEEDQYVMQLFPVSFLPSTPAGKLQTVQELVQAGFVTQEQALSLLDFPDLEGFTSLATAAQDNIERYLELMIEEGKYNPPEPFMNLQLALTLTQEAYLRAKCEDTPEDRLELLRTFMDDCQTLMQASAPPPEVPPMDPLANPVAPPTSDILPLPGAAPPGLPVV